MGGLRLAAVLGLIGSTACTYVGQSAYNAQLCEVDEDKDGVPALECTEDGVSAGVKDCNDADPAIFLGAVEVPYDGTDQDCDGLEIVDVDGDGYPGISQADFDAIGGGAVWPTDVAPEVDCDDDDAGVNPGASDAYYDGVDSDCAGDDDFDADRDGWVPIEYGSAYDGPLPLGDCDDTKADVNPAVPPASDLWYDGVDQDCSGNNDFDQDGDGWMPDNPYPELDDAEWVGLINEYMSFYGYDYQVEGRLGDCRDEPDANLTDAALAPEAVYPGAPDLWYDAVDADCAGDNDFDADVDGWMPPEAEYGALFAEYVKWWDFTEAPVWGDCDDAAVLVHPTANERLGDATDQDCDGGVDTTPLAYGTFQWDGPLGVEAGRVGDRYLIVTGALAFTDTVAATTFEWVGKTVEFAADAGYMAAPLQHLTWINQATARPLGNRIDAIFEEDRYYAAASYIIETTPKSTRLEIKENLWDADAADWVQQTATGTFSSGATVFSYGDVDLVRADDGTLWSAACGAGALQAVAVDASSGALTVLSEAALLGPNATTCAISTADAAQADVIGCVGASCDAWRVAGSTISNLPAAPSDSWHLDELNGKDGALIRVEAAFGATIDDGVDPLVVLTDHTLYAADFTWWDGQLFVVAAAGDIDGDGVRDAILAWGDPAAGPLTEAIWPMADGTTKEVWRPDHVALVVDDDRIMIALAGTSSVGATDAVGWAFLEHAR